MKFYSLFIVLFFPIISFAQQANQVIEFKLSINHHSINVGKKYFSHTLSDSIYFDAIRFYISNIQFFQDDVFVSNLKKKHHLVDLEKQESLKIDLGKNATLQFNKIKFDLGIDSLTNVSGAFGGDLDPTNGMYWTWQSGYINFKLEGVTPSCPARKNFFQFHLGGYQAPFANVQSVELDIFDKKNIIIGLPIDQILEKINVPETYEIMSPNQPAVDMAELIASLFYISK
ncbi:MAG: MbnP family protein [Saprospiraceae bacterium]